MSPFRRSRSVLGQTPFTARHNGGLQIAWGSLFSAWKTGQNSHITMPQSKMRLIAAPPPHDESLSAMLPLAAARPIP
jgi:hypothetical protein